MAPTLGTKKVEVADHFCIETKDKQSYIDQRKIEIHSISNSKIPIFHLRKYKPINLCDTKEELLLQETFNVTAEQSCSLEFTSDDSAPNFALKKYKPVMLNDTKEELLMQEAFNATVHSDAYLEKSTSLSWHDDCSINVQNNSSVNSQKNSPLKPASVSKKHTFTSLNMNYSFEEFERKNSVKEKIRAVVKPYHRKEESIVKVKKVREPMIMEIERKETQSKEKQSEEKLSKDKQINEKQSKEHKSKEHHSKEKQSKEKQSKETQSKERQSKEKQSKERQSKETQNKERQNKKEQQVLAENLEENDLESSRFIVLCKKKLEDVSFRNVDREELASTITNIVKILSPVKQRPSIAPLVSGPIKVEGDMSFTNYFHSSDPLAEKILNEVLADGFNSSLENENCSCGKDAFLDRNELRSSTYKRAILNSHKENLGRAMNKNLGRTPNENFGKSPNENFGKSPNENFGKSPNENFAKSPNENFGKSPNENLRKSFNERKKECKCGRLDRNRVRKTMPARTNAHVNNVKLLLNKNHISNFRNRNNSRNGTNQSPKIESNQNPKTLGNNPQLTDAHKQIVRNGTPKPTRRSLGANSRKSQRLSLITMRDFLPKASSSVLARRSLTSPSVQPPTFASPIPEPALQELVLSKASSVHCDIPSLHHLNQKVSNLVLDLTDIPLDGSFDFDVLHMATIQDKVVTANNDGDDELSRQSKKDDDVAYFKYRTLAYTESSQLIQLSDVVRAIFKSSQLKGTELQRESERLLLISSAKTLNLVGLMRQSYLKPLYQSNLVCDYRIGGLRFQIQTNTLKREKYNYYYVCLLQYRDQVFASKIQTVGKEGYIAFDEYFVFKNISFDFSIEVQLHVLEVPWSPSLLRTVLHLNNNYFTNLSARPKFLLRHLVLQTNTPEEKLVLTSAFQMCYSTSVSLKTPIGLNKYSLQTHKRIRIRTANIEERELLGANCVDQISGKVTFGLQTNCDTWLKAWGVLKGDILCFYRNKMAAMTSEDPVHKVNLRNLKEPEAIRAKEPLCNQPNALHLKVISFDSSSFPWRTYLQDFFLCFEDDVELSKWQNHINCVVNYLHKYKVMHFC